MSISVSFFNWKMLTKRFWISDKSRAAFCALAASVTRIAGWAQMAGMQSLSVDEHCSCDSFKNFSSDRPV
jgi:hypothetical protein